MVMQKTIIVGLRPHSLMDDRDDDDFYVVIPSNSCPDLYPENTANKYLVSWKNDIELKKNTKWKVALVEANFNYTKSTVTTDYGIQYVTVEKLTHTFDCDLYLSRDITQSRFMEPNQIFPMSTHPTFDEWTQPQLTVINTIDGKRKMTITANFEFTITFGALQIANICGFSTLVVAASRQSDQHYVLESYPTFYTNKDFNNVTFIELKQSNVIIQYRSRPYSHTRIINFSRNEFWKAPMELTNTIKNQFDKVFQKIDYSDSEKRISFQMKEDIYSLTLKNGFNFVLGYDRSYFQGKKGTQHVYVAKHAPQMNRGINNLYIYSSVCNPTYVGGLKVPLLKSLWLDVDKKDYSFGEVFNVIVKNPMYLPISSTSINNIEINIRSDSGKLIPFIEGSVTSLTLHFKNYG